MDKSLRKCKSCGHEISAKGKITCPSCGAINKQPIYKRTWFIVLMVFLLLGMIGNLGGNKDETNKTNESVDQVSADTTESNEETSNITESEAIENETIEITETLEPMVVTVDELIDALNSNALKAARTYDDQYVELTGELANIDSSGDYFSLHPSDEFSFVGVLCKIGDEHLDAVMEFTEKQQVTVLGTITDVGEVMGYTLKVESIIE